MTPLLLLLLACGGGDAAAPAVTPPASTPAPSTAPAPAEAAAAPAEPDIALYGLRGVDWACAPCQGLDLANLDEVKVSSWLERDPRYGGSKALDGKLETAWCEGADGPGVGETLRITLREERFLDAVGVRGGYFKGEELLVANGRIKALRLTTDAGHDEVMALADPTVALQRDPSIGPEHEAGHIEPGTWYERAATAEIPRHGMSSSDQPIRWLQLEITEVWPGSRYPDTCISEIELLLIDPEDR